MLKFLSAAAFAAAIFLGLPFAAAQDFMGNPSDDKPITAIAGATINVSGTTTAAFDFGFQSRLVKICIDDASGRVFLRLWRGAGAVTDTSTSEASFIAGANGTPHSVPAIPIQGVDSGDAHPFCETWPFKATGILVGYAVGPAASSATLDIWAVPE